jgi:Fic-DOC domain mobile mystery protein B
VGPELTCAPGATPLDPDERAALIPGHIATQGELNEWELQNIIEARQWAVRSREADILSADFMRKLHRQMLGKTWRWAGTFRATEKNIGVAPEPIAFQLRNLLDDIRYQLDHGTFPLRELAARFHHRLVWMHPFANGNGRFARLMTDLLLESRGEKPFSWGSGDLVAAGEIRDRYIAALRAADARDYGPLLEFLEIALPPGNTA